MCERVPGNGNGNAPYLLRWVVNDGPTSRGRTMNVVAQRACKRCRHPMSRVAEIAPFGGGPGLVAFMCTNCGTTDSVLVHEPHTARGADHRRDQNPGRVGEPAAAVNCYLPPLIWF